MFVLLILILANLHCACGDYTVDKCVANDTSHRNCLVTENNTCSTSCINSDLYEATGDNKKCIVKACTAYNATTCHLNDACVLTEENPTKCMSSCVDFKVFLPVDGKCVKSGCLDREPKSLSVFIKVNRVKFNYGYKTNNNVGITVMGLQKNTSFYNGTSNQSDFNYTQEKGFEWVNVKEENLGNVRIQVYTDKQYFIGQAYIDLNEYKTPEGTKKNITVESGNVTIPIQNQTVYIEVGVCTSCASSDWPCGDSTEAEKCFQDLEDCSPTCTSTDDAHYEADSITGICERVCEERTKSREDVWPCGKSYEQTLCYLNTGAGVEEPNCARTCSQEGWYAVKANTGRCELKDCGTRTANLSAIHPCGGVTDCLFDPVSTTDKTKPQCVASCPKDNTHTGESAEGRCVVACGLRTPNVTAAHPCGSPTDCLFDPLAEAGAQCVESCPVDEFHTGEIDSGRCVLGVNCEARPANITEEFPCGPLQDCLYDPLPGDGPECVASCTKDSSHTGEIEDGVCELVCALQKADIGAEFPCGDAEDCVFDPTAAGDEPQCLEACPVDAKHTGVAKDGVCVVACAARKADPGALNPCGDALDCQYDPAAAAGAPQCVEACPTDGSHTGKTTENGVCVLTCVARKPDITATYPCGHALDCLLDPAVPADKPQCVEKCPVDEEHTGEVFSGRCVLGLNCAARKANVSAKYPCGDKLDCQYDPAASTTPQCVIECPEDATHSGEAENGLCLPICTQRTPDPSADIPCGGPHCFLDPTAAAVSVTKPQCVVECPADDTHTGGDEDGKCVLGLNCAARKANASAEYPCGKPDECLYDSLAPATGSQCVGKCPEDATHSGEAAAENGLCLLACALRKADPVADVPCGSLRCLYDPAAGEDQQQCVETCPTDETHTGEAENGVCVQDTTDRKTKTETSWWEKNKLLIIIIAASVGGLILLIIIIVCIVVRNRKKKEKGGEGYESIND